MVFRLLAVALLCAPIFFHSGCGGSDSSGSDAQTTADTSSGNDTQTGNDVVAQADTVQPTQTDLCKLQWAETLKAKSSLDDLKSAFTASNWYESANAVLDRVLPFGKAIMESQGKTKITQWFDDTKTWEGMLDGVTTGVHEGIHMYSSDHGGNGNAVYPIGVNVDVTIAESDFPLRKSIQKYVDASQKSNDKYLLYFTTNDYPEMPEQTFWGTLDEFNAYTTDELLGVLLSDYHTINGFNCGQGLASFMYFVELSLKAARLDAATQYAALLANKESLKGVLTLWSRAAWAWGLVKDFSNNPICPDVSAAKTKLQSLIFAADNIGELEKLRDAYCK